MRIRLSDKGSIDPLLLPLIIATTLTVGLAVFGIWAFSGYSDHKQNVADKVASAVASAEAQLTTALEEDFYIREQQPYKTYTAAATLGSVVIVYPKTWSAYIVEDVGSSQTAMDGYFHPDYVPDINASKFALRVRISNQPYDQVLGDYDSDIQDGELIIQPLQISGVTGVKASGNFDDNTGIKVILPIRDKTLEIWTEMEKYQSELTDVVLQNLSFQP